MLSLLLSSAPNEVSPCIVFCLHKENGRGERSREDGSGTCKRRTRSLLAKRILVTPQKSLGIFLRKIFTRPFSKLSQL